MSNTVWIVLLFAGALLYLMLVSSASEKAKPKPPPPGCDFCRDNQRIIAYRESAYKDLKVADFCPVCGRRISKPPRRTKIKFPPVRTSAQGDCFGVFAIYSDRALLNLPKFQNSCPVSGVSCV